MFLADPQQLTATTLTATMHATFGSRLIDWQHRLFDI